MIPSMQPTGTECVWPKLMTNSKRLLPALLVFAILLISPSAVGSTYIVFRYDDFSADQPGVRQTDALRRQIWQAEQKIDSLFEKYDMSYVIAIIPKANGTSFTEDPEKIELIKQGITAGRIDVAQHGFSHTNHAPQGHIRGEFRERGYKSQLRDITSGKEILCSSCDLVNITTFVPPYNSWDDNTATILKQTGFTILSADRFFYYKSAKGLTVIPCTTRLQKLETVVNEGSLPEKGVMVVLYHPEDIIKLAGREDYFFGIVRFDRLLDKLSVMPNIKVVTLQRLAQKCSDLTIERYHRANKLYGHRYFWKKLLPKHLWPGEQNHEFYLSLDEYSKSLLHWRAAAAGLAIGLFMIGLCIRYLLSLILTTRWRFWIDIIASLLFFLSVLKEIQVIHKGYHITAISAIPAFLMGSFVLTLLVQTARNTIRWTKLAI